MPRIRKLLFLLWIFILLTALSACRSPSVDYFAYREEPFSARLEGNQYGIDMVCDIYCENGSMKKIVFHAPDSLEGLCVSSGSDGSFRMEKDEIFHSFSNDYSWELGLLSPARWLLLEGISEDSVQSIQKISTGHLITILSPSDSGELTVSLGQDGFPTSICGSNFSFRVTKNVNSDS